MWFRKEKSKAEEMTVVPVENDQELDKILVSKLAVLYKHSTSCGVSAFAYREVKKFATEHPEVPVYLVKVIQQRPLSNRIADHFEIRHESPQAFVIKEGSETWNGSHQQVTAANLALQVG